MMPTNTRHRIIPFKAGWKMSTESMQCSKTKAKLFKCNMLDL